MNGEELNEFGQASIKAGIEDVEQNRINKCYPHELRAQSIGEVLSSFKLVVYYDTLQPEPKWYIGFTNEFIKATHNIDRKLQGRILNVIRDLAKYPDKPKGDTIKPLYGEYKGLWRVRIGEYRLIYRPNYQTKCVDLLSFLSRQEAYS